MDELTRRRAATGAGDGGLTRLVGDEYEPMLRMATLLVGSAAIAEEIVQDGLSAVSRRWDDIERPGAYLRTTVVNGCAMVLRRRSAEERANRLHGATDGVELPSGLVELRDALERLPDRPRVVVVLRYLCDVPDREIAETLGVRPSTVRSLARRALAALREELT